MDTPLKKPQQLDELLATLGGARYLLCVDLEATCNNVSVDQVEKGAQGPVITVEEMEAIEIGAVLLDLNCPDQAWAEFSQFIKPVIHSRLTAFCTALTTIQQADVDAASGYAEVSQALTHFLAPYASEGIAWCSWGRYDYNQLQRDAMRLECEPMLAGMPHINLKKIHSKAFKCKAVGLRGAVESLGLKWRGQHHRATCDSRNLAQVCLKMLKLRALAL